jgi:hypothetical protein
MGMCKNCGETVEPGTKFCENCGAAVDDKPVTQPPQAPVIKETPAAQPPEPRKKPMAIPHLYLIVGIVVVVIIIAALLASGVLSISVTATTKDKIIGVWRHTDPDGLDVRFRFNADGSLVGSGYTPNDKATQVLYGSWRTLGNNSYEIIWTDGSTFKVIFDPARNVIYDPKYPGILSTPYQGDVMAASTPLSTKTTTTQLPKATVSSAKDPLVGVWRFYDATDGFDDRFRFYADGTMAYSHSSLNYPTIYYDRGTWTNQGGNSYIATDHLTYNFVYDPARNAIYEKTMPQRLFTPYLGDLEGV